jgi:hypothetical protein
MKLRGLHTTTNKEYILGFSHFLLQEKSDSSSIMSNVCSIWEESMAAFASSQEVEAILSRSKALVEQGVVAGVRDQHNTALYLAANEVVDAANLDRIVLMIREGLDANSIASKEPLIRKLAVFVLVDLASRRNGKTS